MSHAHRAAARSASVSHAALGSSSNAPELEPILSGLVDQALEAIRAGNSRSDEVFGNYAELNSFVRAVTFHEGILLEQGLERLASLSPDLRVIKLSEPLPIVPAALELLERNDWDALEAIHLRSDVHYRMSYSPDLLILDRVARRAIIIDVKRSLSSYQESKLKALRRKMMAAALTAGDVLHQQGRQGIAEIDIAIIDGSDEQSAQERGVFALREVGELLRLPYAGEAMLRLRRMFAERVQDEMQQLCQRIVVNPSEPDRTSSDDFLVSIDEDAEDEGEEAAAMGAEPMPPIRVGYARGLGAIDPAGRA
ncbi:hypothetical protein JYP52_18800 [Nitratireductor aquibiodomus]|uniref:hypothetical protein n=1 Tax=Nitratireductor aquibiodomus TaxID=204799 RepID=UPI0019D356F8|nr:hypothetical protein [Nitratireductor aquibiodomus]MBN7763195.1 hypothetical protein [Nitratireductor aquibiodomus]